MKKLKKISLNKEKIVNLNNENMNALKGGTSSGVCKFSLEFSLAKTLDWTLKKAESIMKNNTVWVGCTTDPARSKAYTTPGCIKPEKKE